jgi:hypothetical protein
MAKTTAAVRWVSELTGSLKPGMDNIEHGTKLLT